MELATLNRNAVKEMELQLHHVQEVLAFVVFLDYLVEEDHQRTTLTSQPSWIPINVFIQFVG